MVQPITPSLFGPRDINDLHRRVEALAGRTIGEVARDHGREAPNDLRHAKGFVGELTEAALGAPRSNRSAPDFVGLGVELKTLPVDARGAPAESTYICRVDPKTLASGLWEESRVRNKLNRVLFVPVSCLGPVPERSFGAGFFWNINDDEKILRADWEDFSEWAQRGALSEITARRGQAMQMRPKAKNRSVTQKHHDVDGEAFESLPKGFYLRPSFTKSLITRVFGGPHGTPSV